MDPVMRSKVENDTSAWLRSLVTKRGRNADLAEQTIRQAKAFTEKEALAKASNAQALEMNFKGIFLDEGRRILG